MLDWFVKLFKLTCVIAQPGANKTQSQINGRLSDNYVDYELLTLGNIYFPSFVITDL